MDANTYYFIISIEMMCIRLCMCVFILTFSLCVVTCGVMRHVKFASQC